MPIEMFRFERRDGVDRNEFAQSVLEWCRRWRTTNELVRSARYFWEDGGNTVVVLVEGAPGFADYNENPDADLAKALFRLHDLARLIDQRRWADAGPGTRNWERAGRPSGVA